MAGFASIHADHGMLIEERSALFRVALQTRFFVGQCLVIHARAVGHAPRGEERPVRVVAIRAVHEAFVDAMLEGHGELRANIRVAAIAEIGLAAGQQEFWRLELVYGVAPGANHSVQGVRAAPDVGA